MDNVTFEQIWMVYSTIGAPLAVLYAIHRGWLATRREVTLLQDSLLDLREQYRHLSERVEAEQLEMRRELETTRTQLIDMLTKGSHHHAD